MRLKRGAVLAMAIFMAQLATTTQVYAGPDTTGYKIAFQEEFSGKKLDTRKWNYLLPWGAINNKSNREMQGYKQENIVMAGSSLSIIGKAENYKGYKYTSGMINTYDKFSQQYGIWEISYKMPANVGSGKGYWPAFWLLSGSKGKFSWPPELDILEAGGPNPKKVAHCVHWVGDKHSCSTIDIPYDGSIKYVTVTVDWQPTYIKWYVNGKLTKTVTDSAAIPKVPMYILLNMAIGAPDWSLIGVPDKTTKFQGIMKVDYIRVWKKG